MQANYIIPQPGQTRPTDIYAVYAASRAKRAAGLDNSAEMRLIRAYWVRALKVKDNPSKTLSDLLDEYDAQQARLAAVAEAERIVAEAQGVRRGAK